MSARPATTVVIEVPDLAAVAHASDLELIAAMKAWSEARRRVDAGLSRLADLVAKRSTLELGHDGLAQRAGARGPEGFVSTVTGVSLGEARSMVTAGGVMHTPAPWLANVAADLAAGELSVGAAAAITTGLGVPTESVAADDLIDAARRLATEARKLPPEKVARRVREVRDELDARGVADREADLRARRFLRLTPLPSGMTRLSGELDPESAALVSDAFDAVTAPRRGGPRFVDAEERARAAQLVDDPRTNAQLTLDAFVEMIRIAGAADPGRVFGVRRPAVRVHVSGSELACREGAGSLEGQTASVSLATVERLACAEGYVPVVFEPDGELALGRAQRLFTEKQRVVLAAIWGGCAVPDCDRPPSWTEAHHALEWDRDHGPTDVSNGVLLCRFHHMMVHNGGWSVRRRRDTWVMEPPPGDSMRRETVLVSKHPEHLQRSRR